jgi:hypothetical protein
MRNTLRKMRTPKEEPDHTTSLMSTNAHHLDGSKVFGGSRADALDLKEGMVQMREEGKGKFLRYHVVLTSSELLFFRKQALTTSIVDVEPDLRFQLLKVMLKDDDTLLRVRLLFLST